MKKLLLKLFMILSFIESTNNLQTIGDSGNSIGIVQIQKICIDDVNRIYKTSYTYEDRLDINKSKEIFIKYLTYYGKQYQKVTCLEPDMEIYARIWNGGPDGYLEQCTESYWCKVLDYGEI